MQLQELEKQILSQGLSPVYLFLEEESYWIDRLTQAIRQALEQKYPQFETLTFDENDWTVDRLISEFSVFSMFSSHRFIRVLNAEKIKKNEWEMIATRFHETKPDLTLLLIFHKKDLFKEASRVFSGQATIAECSKIKPKDLPVLLTWMAKELSKVLNPYDARLLIDYLGTDLLMLQNQLVLLSIYVGEKRVIEEQDIRALFSEISDKDSFALTKAIGESNPKILFRLLRQLLRQGEAPLRLLALIIRHYRLVFRSKLLLKRGEKSPGIASTLRLPPFVIETYLQQAQKISWKKSFEIYRDLLKVDRALKSSALPHRVWLEGFFDSVLGG